MTHKATVTQEFGSAKVTFEFESEDPDEARKQVLKMCCES